jgi:hypothetical protein
MIKSHFPDPSPIFNTREHGSAFTLQSRWIQGSLSLSASRVRLLRVVSHTPRPTGGRPREALRHDDDVRARGGAATESHARRWCRVERLASSRLTPLYIRHRTPRGDHHIKGREKETERKHASSSAKRKEIVIKTLKTNGNYIYQPL